MTAFKTALLNVTLMIGLLTVTLFVAAIHFGVEEKIVTAVKLLTSL